MKLGKGLQAFTAFVIVVFLTWGGRFVMGMAKENPGIC